MPVICGGQAVHMEHGILHQQLKKHMHKAQRKENASFQKMTEESGLLISCELLKPRTCWILVRKYQNTDLMK